MTRDSATALQITVFEIWAERSRIDLVHAKSPRRKGAQSRIERFRLTPKFSVRMTSKRRPSRMKKPRKAQSSQKSLPTKKHRPRLSHFARSLLREWRKFQLANDVQKGVVAVSGGADSVALWLALTELVHAGKLDLDIIVAHLDHKLRGDASDADARWVAALAKRLANRAVVRSANVKQ